jgi:hypothetical protein
MAKTRHSVILSVIHHRENSLDAVILNVLQNRQNPLDSGCVPNYFELRTTVLTN